MKLDQEKSGMWRACGIVFRSWLLGAFDYNHLVINIHFIVFISIFCINCCCSVINNMHIHVNRTFGCSEQMSNDDSHFFCGTTTGDILEV